MKRFLPMLAAFCLPSQNATAFDQVKVGDWTVSQYTDGEIPLCEAATKKDDVIVTVNLLAGGGDALLYVTLTPHLVDQFNNNAARAELDFMTDSMKAKSVAGSLVKEDHTPGGFESVFRDRTTVVAALSPASFVTLRLVGSQGSKLIDFDNVQGAPLAKALTDCIDDLETPELAREI